VKAVTTLRAIGILITLYFWRIIDRNVRNCRHFASTKSNVESCWGALHISVI